MPLAGAVDDDCDHSTEALHAEVDGAQRPAAPDSSRRRAACVSRLTSRTIKCPPGTPAPPGLPPVLGDSRSLPRTPGDHTPAILAKTSASLRPFTSGGASPYAENRRLRVLLQASRSRPLAVNARSPRQSSRRQRLRPTASPHRSARGTSNTALILEQRRWSIGRPACPLMFPTVLLGRPLSRVVLFRDCWRFALRWNGSSRSLQNERDEARSMACVQQLSTWLERNPTSQS